MKKAIAILLLSLLLYNTIGYYLYYEYQQVQACHHLRTILDKSDWTEKTLPASQQTPKDGWTVFRIPIGLYHQPDRAPEPVEGEFRYQDKIYEKALRSIRNDTLYLYCVNNYTKEKVQRKLSDHVKTHVIEYTDTHTSKNQKSSKISLIQEYLPLQENVVCFYSTFTLLKQSVSDQPPYLSLFLDIASPPPRFS